MNSHAHHEKHEKQGFWLGLLAVTLFALTLPMSKLAIGNAHTPFLSPWFLSFGRAAVAGILSAAYLLRHRAQWPRGRQWRLLLLIGIGNVIGFPIFQNLGLLYVPSSHAAVFNGLLPLATAVIAALILHHKASWKFWAWAVSGPALVICFALWRAYQADGHFSLHSADIFLFLAILLCGFGYAYGALLSREMPAAQALCWMLVVFLPLTIPAAMLTMPTQPVPVSAWIGFAYCAVVSMWAGMMIWFYALHIGGAVRVSQVQIIQPFLAILFAVPILGERFDWMTLLFAAGVVFTAYQGKKASLPSHLNTKITP